MCHHHAWHNSPSLLLLRLLSLSPQPSLLQGLGVQTTVWQVNNRCILGEIKRLCSVGGAGGGTTSHLSFVGSCLVALSKRLDKEQGDTA